MLSAYDFKEGDLCYNIISNIVPYEVEVTYEIEPSIFESTSDNYSGITVVVIPESVTYSGITYSVTGIGDYAFDACSSLTSINIPDGLNSIGDYAFNDCTSLLSIHIPDGVTSIGYGAFRGCSSWSGDITIPDGITSIEGSAFAGCSSLTSIKIPNSVTSIEDYAFDACSSLTSINIPDGLNSIGEYVFYRCTSLPSITLPNGVTSIGPMAFGHCSSLTSIKIPNGVTSIGDWAFSYCSGLTSVTCEANTPPAVETRAFYQIPTDIPVYVPCESLTTYQTDEGWSYFTNVQCLSKEESAVEDINSPSTNTPKIFRDGQLIIIRDGVNYNAQGAVVK